MSAADSRPGPWKSLAGGRSGARAGPHPALELPRDCGQPGFYQRSLSACWVNGSILRSHPGPQNDDFVTCTWRAVPSGSGSEKPVKSQSSFPVWERNRNMSESDLCCFSLLNRFQTLVRLWRRLGAEPGGPGKGGRGRAEARAGREWLPSWALQFARTGRPRTPEAFRGVRGQHVIAPSR